MAINNTGGWQLTSQTVARGGRTQTDNGDGTAESTIDNDATKAALQFLHDVKWEDKAFGSKVDPRLGNHQPGVRGRQHRHVHLGFRHLHRTRAGLRHETRAIYGMTVVPMEGR